MRACIGGGNYEVLKDNWKALYIVYLGGGYYGYYAVFKEKWKALGGVPRR